MRKSILPAVLLTAVFSVGTITPVWADNGEMIAMLEGLKKQMAQMQQTIDAQNLRLQQLESRRVLETRQPETPLQPAPAAQTTMSDKGAKFGGDFRLRHEYFDFFDKNTEAGATDRDRNRFRARLRWGFEKDYGDDWKVGFRLATGNTTDQLSTNQTLGNSGYFTFKSFNLERAMASYTPTALKNKGALKEVKIAAGKTDNPFQRYSTLIVWDADVTPEGLYETSVWQLWKNDTDSFNATATAGQFLVNENTATESDAQLFAYQTSLGWSTQRFSNEPVELTTAVSWYDYTNWFQTVTNNSASTSYLRTNSIVADNFRVLDIYPEVQFNVAGTPVVLWTNWVENTANVGTEDLQQSLGNDIHDADDAWGAGLKLGKIKKKGDFEWFYGYYEIGANAAVAAFSEGDFGGPGNNGFTNRQGHRFGLGYGLTKDITLNWTALVVKPLNPFNDNGTIGIQNSANEKVFRSQLDINYKF